MRATMPSMFRLAKKESTKSNHTIKVGAVLVRKNHPICVGSNKITTHPKYANPSKHVKNSIHAEIACLMQSDIELKGYTIYVYREGKNGLPAMSRPCPDCLEVLTNRGISRIIYSIPHPPYYREENI